MGSYADAATGAINTAASEVSSAFTNLKDKADTLWLAAKNELQALKEFIEGKIPLGYIPPEFSIDYTAHTANINVSAEYPSEPDWDWPDDIDEPVFSETLSEYPWTNFPTTSLENVRNLILARFADLAADGATSIDPDVEDDLWDRARERLRATREDKYKEVEKYFSSRGFSLPTGALNGKLLELATEFDKTDELLTMDIAVKHADLEQNNKQYILTSGLNAINAMEANRIAMVSERNKGILSEFLSRLEVYKTRVTARSIKIDALVKKYGGQLDLLKTKSRVSELEMEAAYRSYELLIINAKNASELQLAAIRESMEQYRALYTLAASIIGTYGSLTAQLTASALTAIHASASISGSGAASVSASAGESIVYQHYYDETAAE